MKWALISRKFWIRFDGRPKILPSWLDCVTQVKDYFLFGVSAMYAQNYWDDSEIQKAKLIVDYTKKAFQEMIENKEWIDEETKKSLIDKTNSMSFHVGAPIELFNDSIINEIYNEVSIYSTESYFQTVINMKKWRMDESSSRLCKGRSTEEYV